jgi:hypothetical protein
MADSVGSGESKGKTELSEEEGRQGQTGQQTEKTEAPIEPTLTWVTQHVLFPRLRNAFHPHRALAKDGTVTQVANLENLYKIFERC